MTPEQLNADVLAAMKMRVSALRPAMDLIGHMMVSSAQQNFEAGGRPLPWAPLAESTRKQKEKLGFTKILVQTTHLLQSLNSTASDTGVRTGTNLPYARIQQEGGTISFRAGRHGVLNFLRNKKSGKSTLASNARISKLTPRSRSEHVQKAYVSKAYSAFIPARPYLIFQPDEPTRYADLVTRFVTTGALR